MALCSNTQSKSKKNNEIHTKEKSSKKSLEKAKHNRSKVGHNWKRMQTFCKCLVLLITGIGDWIEHIHIYYVFCYLNMNFSYTNSSFLQIISNKNFQRIQTFSQINYPMLYQSSSFKLLSYLVNQMYSAVSDYPLWRLIKIGEIWRNLCSILSSVPVPTIIRSENSY